MTTPDLAAQLIAYHDADHCSEWTDAKKCSGDCVTMRELRAAAKLALDFAAALVIERCIDDFGTDDEHLADLSHSDVEFLVDSIRSLDVGGGR